MAGMTVLEDWRICQIRLRDRPYALNMESYSAFSQVVSCTEATGPESAPRTLAQRYVSWRSGSAGWVIAEHLEKGEPGVGISTLADILAVFGLVERLSDLIDIRKDELGMALDAERMPRCGRSSINALRRRPRKGEAIREEASCSDQDGVAF